MSGITTNLGLITPDINVDMGDQYLLDEEANLQLLDTELGPLYLSVFANGYDLEMVVNQKGLIVKTSTGVRYRINVSDIGAVQATAL